jgi:hypothetical protein
MKDTELASPSQAHGGGPTTDMHAPSNIKGTQAMSLRGPLGPKWAIYAQPHSTYRAQ